MTSLLDAVRRYSEIHAGADSVTQTPIEGLSVVRATAPSDLIHAISRPLVCLVLQGSKHVAMGTESFAFSAGASLLITADVPTVNQITTASAGKPYFSLVLELNPAVIAELAGEMRTVLAAADAPIRVDPTEHETADAALRLMRLLDRPAAMRVLQDQLVREMHYWLLAGRHGYAIRRLGWPDGHRRRVARAIDAIRADFTKPLRVEWLAEKAGMSQSSFFRHFRAATTLSPRQFQKQLRLIEGRRLMLAKGATASSAAFAVGYESVQQFTREYGRMFGLPPGRDIEAKKGLIAAAA